jgi:hypothetical protein
MGKGAWHLTWGYFVAYSGFGAKGTKNYRLDEEIDHIGNGVGVVMHKSGKFQILPKKASCSRKKGQKSYYFCLPYMVNLKCSIFGNN